MADAFLIRSGGGENLDSELSAQETIIQNIQESLVGKVYGANATPETILKGYSAYVHQELVEGTYEPMSGIDYGYVNLSSTQNTITVNHNLGVTPRTVILVGNPVNTYVTSNWVVSMVQAKDGTEKADNAIKYYGEILQSGSNKVSYDNNSDAIKFADYNENTIVFKLFQNASSSYQYPSGSRYLWIAIA